MRTPPDYFKPIQDEATRRWEQLEADPGLAGPWKQLFNQVQSPRHILSELLQNADDAGATWAAARLENNCFYFVHNGRDFDEASFRSLCNFGYSNKRHLHTIGFRGMGFKSTFSLGPRVEVWTPTIAVAFEKNRFTEPKWLVDAPYFENLTTIKVNIQSPETISWLHSNFEAWLSSSIPLLFFTNIREIELQGQTVRKLVEASGPVPDSEWVILEGKQNLRILHCWSKPDDLPNEALHEVREERGSPELELPPCEVHILLGMQDSQRIYVVLPTEVLLDLPFSCNAPFIPDPARTGIKEPVSSPTNKWLLGRVGELAASVMSSWLQNDSLTLEARAQAYELLPPVLIGQSSLKASCQNLITEHVREFLKEKAILLSTDGRLATARDCLGLPPALLDVWKADELLQIFALEHTCLLSDHVNETVRKRLAQWGWLQPVPSEQVLKILCQAPFPPQPESYEHVARLWDFIHKVAQEVKYWWQQKELAIVPVQKRETLFPAKEVLVVSGKDRQFTEDEWAFLGQHVNMADADWIEEVRANEKSSDDMWQGARQLLLTLGLDRSIGVEIIVRKVAEKIFTNPQPDAEGIQLAHIAARLNVQIFQDFKFLCQDGKWHPVADGLLSYKNSTLDQVIPDTSVKRVTLDDRYDPGQQFRQIWVDWLHSDRSGIRQFIVPHKQTKSFYSQYTLGDFFTQRGENAPSYYPRKRGTYGVDDYDFDEELWSYWESLEKEDPAIWAHIIKLIAADWDELWVQHCKAQAFQSSNQKTHFVGRELAASWLYRLRNKPCLLDRFGTPELPHLLLRLTPETSPLQGIDSFLHPDFDRPENLQFLDMLGVRGTPSGASGDILINRLQSLSKSASVPLLELTRIYQALDGVCLYASTQELEKIRGHFDGQDLVYSQDGKWHPLNQVFMRNDDEIPGMVVLHGELASLSLWTRLGIRPSPKIEDALNWLRELSPGKSLKGDDTKRIVSILRKAPATVWKEIGCWLSLDNTWETTQKFQWLAFSAGAKTGLFSWVTSQTADGTFLDISDTNPLEFTALASLETTLTYTITKRFPEAEPQPLHPWLAALGRNLSRLRSAKRRDLLTEAEPDYAASRTHAKRLLQTKLYDVEQLEVTPYMDGQPAGEGNSPTVLWLEDFLYIQESGPRSHRELVKVFTDVFQNPNLRAAIRDCIERDPSWIDQYFEHNFDLEDHVISQDVPYELSEQSPSNDDKESLDSLTHQNDETDSSKVEQPPSLEHDRVESDVDGTKGQKENGPDDGTNTVKRRSRRPEGERVAPVFRELGFFWQAHSKRFVHSNGSWIQHGGASFDWEEFDSQGTMKHRYWVGAPSLEKGIEIPHEVWEMMKALPENNRLLLPDDHGTFVVYRWQDLQDMLQSRALSLHPSRYRLTSQKAVEQNKKAN